MQSKNPLTEQCDQSPSSNHDRAWGDLTMLIAFLFDTVGRYLRYRSQLAAMAELDDRTLSDIGLDRSELRAVARHTASHWAQR
jgi:uncharacterized protein YjiS (DUF1127 family)